MFFNIIIIFIIFIILIIILFLLNNNLNKYMNKYNSYEYFERIGNPLYGTIPAEEYHGCQINCIHENKNLLCGNDNDICSINENNISTCCNGYSCKRNPGNFNYKVCIKDDLNNGELGSKLLNYGIRPNIDYPNSNFNPDSISKYNSDSNINNGELGSKLLNYNYGIRPNIDYPNFNFNPDSISKYNSDSNINSGFLNDNFLKNPIFSSSVCPSK